MTNKILKTFTGKRIFIFITMIFMCSFNTNTQVLAHQPPPTRECCSCHVEVERTSEREWETGSTAGSPSSWPTVPRLVNHVVTELTAHRIWMISVFWEDNVLPAMMLMSEQLTAVALKQTQIIGSFIDAKHQMETQRLLQTIRAQTHKDYQPSIGLCEFGSGIKSMAASERKGEYNAFALAQKSQDRQLGNANNAAAYGPSSDKESRIKQFINTYCDSADNDDGLSKMCKGGSPDRKNSDIDFIRTVAQPKTLEVDFTEEAKTNDEEDVLALASNLYGHHVFSRVDPKQLEDISKTNISEAQKHYMEMRSIIAKRSVAENSYNAIVGMKAQGAKTGNVTLSQPYLKEILKEMGLSEEDATEMIGENPSYYAQMEIIGKKIFQNPDFYTHLYDKPANVERKQVAMQAIGLMQKFDLFKSQLRNEASLSILLELAVMDLQSEIENDINPMGPAGEESGIQ